jgi:uncharacterized protein YkwD
LSRPFHRNSDDSQDGDTVTKRVSSEGVSYSGVGENIASGPNVERARHGLMDSPGHRQNIMSKDFTDVGIDIVKKIDDTIIVMQDFIYRD